MICRVRTAPASQACHRLALAVFETMIAAAARSTGPSRLSGSRPLGLLSRLTRCLRSRRWTGRVCPNRSRSTRLCAHRRSPQWARCEQWDLWVPSCPRLARRMCGALSTRSSGPPALLCRLWARPPRRSCSAWAASRCPTWRWRVPLPPRTRSPHSIYRSRATRSRRSPLPPPRPAFAQRLLAFARTATWTCLRPAPALQWATGLRARRRVLTRMWPSSSLLLRPTSASISCSARAWQLLSCPLLAIWKVCPQRRATILRAPPLVQTDLRARALVLLYTYSIHTVHRMHTPQSSSQF